jgi:hypothetical protein
MSFYLAGALSGREAALAVKRPAHRFWNAESTLQNFVDTIEGLLRQKPSVMTNKALSQQVSSAKAVLQQYRTLKPK